MFLVSLHIIVFADAGEVFKQLLTPTINHDTQLGPVLDLFCGLSTSECLNYCNYTWIFGNKTLAVNDDKKLTGSSRYSVTLKEARPNPDGTFFYGSVLQFQNALLEDAGLYECQISYRNESFHESINVSLFQYLPPHDYPKCVIAPHTTVVTVSNMTFTCIAGESNPGVNLRMSLQLQDGSVLELGNTTEDAVVTKSVRIDDSEAVFTCHMTSEKFPTAYRNCSLGLLMASQPNGQIGIIVGASVGAAAVLILIIILLLLVLLKKRKK